MNVVAQLENENKNTDKREAGEEAMRQATDINP